MATYTFEPSLPSILTRHIDSHQTAGVDWPASATHAVVYRVSTWPMGWSRETSISFFDSESQLNDWIQKYNEWSRLEDNYVAYQAYVWDLGPSPMTGVCREGAGLSCRRANVIG